MGKQLHNPDMKIHPLNTQNRAVLYIGSKRHSLRPEDLIALRDLINSYFFFETNIGVSAEDYAFSAPGETE